MGHCNIVVMVVAFEEKWDDSCIVKAWVEIFSPGVSGKNDKWFESNCGEGISLVVVQLKNEKNKIVATLELLACWAHNKRLPEYSSGGSLLWCTPHNAFQKRLHH